MAQKQLYFERKISLRRFTYPDIKIGLFWCVFERTKI
jgi:hypothetical protein